MIEESVLTWDQHETVRLLKGAPGTKYQEGSDTDRHIIRDWVRSILRTGPATVNFTKADGTLRNMTCTLKWELIPQEVQTRITSESTKKKDVSDETLRVFDLDKKEWRSFRFDRLNSVSATISIQ